MRLLAALAAVRKFRRQEQEQAVGMRQPGFGERTLYSVFGESRQRVVTGNEGSGESHGLLWWKALAARWPWQQEA